MHDARRPSTELRLALSVFGTGSAAPEPATEGSVSGRLEAEAVGAAGMRAALGGAGGADVLRGTDTGVMAAAALVPASSGAALTCAPASRPDMPTFEVGSRPIRQSETSNCSTQGARCE
jgi:hypothetical protein